VEATVGAKKIKIHGPPPLGSKPARFTDVNYCKNNTMASTFSWRKRFFSGKVLLSRSYVSSTLGKVFSPRAHLYKGK
jgi:hypothetical protein